MRHKNSNSATIYYKTLGQVLEEIRLNKNKSMRLIADEYDITQSLISRVINGQNDPHLSSLLSICEALGANLSEVIAETEKRLPKDFTLMDW